MHHVTAVDDTNAQVAYWHRELPPLDAEVIGEFVVEASSTRVPGTIAHRDDLWRICYDDLMARTGTRLQQEVSRLGGHYAHVFDETIDTRRDEATGEAWLRGRFAYVLYRRPRVAGTESSNARADGEAILRPITASGE